MSQWTGLGDSADLPLLLVQKSCPTNILFPRPSPNGDSPGVARWLRTVT